MPCLASTPYTQHPYVTHSAPLFPREELILQLFTSYAQAVNHYRYPIRGAALGCLHVKIFIKQYPTGIQPQRVLFGVSLKEVFKTSLSLTLFITAASEILPRAISRAAGEEVHMPATYQELQRGIGIARRIRLDTVSLSTLSV